MEETNQNQQQVNQQYQQPYPQQYQQQQQYQQPYPQYYQNNIKQCKKCKSYIYKSASVCPVCRKSQIGTIWWILLFFIIFTSLFLSCRGGNSQKNETTVTGNSTDTSAQANITASDGMIHVKVGQTFNDNDLYISINSFEDNYTGNDDKYAFNKPIDGYKHIKVSVTMENKGTSSQYIDIYCFACYADDESYDQQYLSDDSFINTNLASGKKKTFDVFFDVPIDSKKVELIYQKTFSFSEPDIVIDLINKE